MRIEAASNTGAFFIRFGVSFFLGALVMLPLITLGLGLTLMVVVPPTLGAGAIVASVSSWALTRLLESPEGTPSFLSILGRGASTAALLLVAIVLLFMWGVFIAPWIAMLLVSAAVIAYRVS